MIKKETQCQVRHVVELHRKRLHLVLFQCSIKTEVRNGSASQFVIRLANLTNSQQQSAAHWTFNFDFVQKVPLRGNK